MAIRATEGVKSENAGKKPAYDFDYYREQATVKVNHAIGQISGVLCGQIPYPNAAPSAPENTSACGFSG